MSEQWRRIEGFPNYSISDSGRVARKTKHGRRLLKPRSGMVALGRANERSVNALVRDAFGVGEPIPYGGRPVVMLHVKTGNVAKFPSAEAAANEGFCGSAIRACCHGQRFTHAGCKWWFERPAQ